MKSTILRVTWRILAMSSAGSRAASQPVPPAAPGAAAMAWGPQAEAALEHSSEFFQGDKRHAVAVSRLFQMGSVIISLPGGADPAGSCE